MTKTEIETLQQIKPGSSKIIEVVCISEAEAENEDRAVFLYRENNGLVIVDNFFKVVGISSKT